MAATEFDSLSLRNDANLVAYWKLEDTTAEINSPTFDFTNNNTIQFNAAKFNNGADGQTGNTNKFLDLANDVGVDGGSITISFWVRLIDEIGAGSWTFAEQGGGTSFVNNIISYEFNGGTRRLNFNRQEQNVANNSIFHTVTLGTADLNHLCYTYDSGGTRLRLYFNGVQQGSDLSTSGSGSGGTSDHVFTHARRGAGGYPDAQQLASAIVDDLVIFDRELIASEVADIFEAPPPVTFIPRVMIF